MGDEPSDRCRGGTGVGEFFVSSRGRHGRFDCDWSSDVCSSDLLHLVAKGVFQPADWEGYVAGLRDRFGDRPCEPLTGFGYPVYFPETQHVFWFYPVDGNLRRSEEHTSELQSQSNLVSRLLLEQK